MHCPECFDNNPQKEVIMGHKSGDWICSSCGCNGPRSMFEIDPPADIDLYRKIRAALRKAYTRGHSDGSDNKQPLSNLRTSDLASQFMEVECA